jgi:kynureninase
VTPTRAEALRLDAEDPFREKRALFALPEGVIYLDGNSLGPPTKAALARLETCAEMEWGEGLIRSWDEAGWIDLPRRCGAKIAPLIGAEPDEVLVCDSVSVNLFKLAAALLADAPGAALVVAEDEFPTDMYIFEGLSRFAGRPLLRPSEGGGAPQGRIEIRSCVHYRSAAIADMKAAEAAAREAGDAVIWDLSHAAGAIAIDVKRAGARFAVGCGYKFLNGGPGAPAFLYVAGDCAGRLAQPISGWMGHAAPFDFAPTYRPAGGVARFAAGTPAILSLAALDAALDVYADVDMAAAERKARALGDLFLARTESLSLPSATPPGVRRGAQVGLRFARGCEVMRALAARGIIGDFRPPDLMRFGFSPLCLSYAEVFDAAGALCDVLATEEWRDPRFAAPRLAR